MSAHAPRVSIGMPVYNGAEFLEATLESLVAQSFEDFELVISDNASTDDTESICRSLAARDGRVRYYRQDRNRGAAWNYNFVFHQARGEYFKWAACDDLCGPTFLARCVELLDRDPGVAWCHPESIHIDAVGRELPGTLVVNYAKPDADQSTLPVDGPRTPPTRESQHAHDRFRAILLGPDSNIDVFGLMRTDAVARTALHLPYYGSDKVFVAELALAGRFGQIHETLFAVRVHAGASGHMTTAAQQQYFISGNSSARLVWWRPQLVRGYASAIRRADLSVTERVGCVVVLVRYLLQVSKWRRVVVEFFSGVGIGGTPDVDRPRETPGEGKSSPVEASTRSRSMKAL